MRIQGVIKTVAVWTTVAVVSTLAVLLLTSCDRGNASASSVNDTSPAATVNGETITNQEVDDYIAGFRATSESLSSDEGWQEFLSANGYTEASFRREVAVNELIRYKLVEQAAADAGITVDEDYVDSEFNAQKSRYESEDVWKSALSSCGYTEESYRAQLEYSYLTQKLKDQLDVPPATDAQIQEYCNEHAAEFSGKRYSQILFDHDEEGLAWDVYDELCRSDDAGAEFAQCVERYSTDRSTKASGGDVGWTSIVGVPSPCGDVLDSLSVGEFSEPIQTNYGYLILYCSDEFAIPANGRPVVISGIPPEIYDELVEDLDDQLRDEAYDQYLDQLYQDADIKIY